MSVGHRAFISCAKGSDYHVYTTIATIAGAANQFEPAMLSMLGFGLLGLGFFARRRRV